MDETLSAPQLLDKAYLEAASAALVYQWLERRGPITDFHQERVPAETLRALRDRNDPLINLALAHFATSGELLLDLFRTADERLQCAVLSNISLGTVFAWPWPLPEGLFTHEGHCAFVENAPTPLLQAYLCNPSVENILAALFSRTHPFESVSDERWQQAIIFSAGNPLLQVNNYDHPLDQPRRSGAATEGWGLLELTPVTPEWASVLTQLYTKMPYDHCPRIFALPLAELPDLSDLGPFRDKVQNLECEFFDAVLQGWNPEGKPREIAKLFAELRRVIASRWPVRNTLVDELLRNHEHQHVRLGYYQRFEPVKVEEVQTAYDRDGEAFVAAAVENPWFYQTGGFHSVCSEFSRLARENATTSNRYEWLWLKRHPYATVFDRSSFARVDDDCSASEHCGPRRGLS